MKKLVSLLMVLVLTTAMLTSALAEEPAIVHQPLPGSTYGVIAEIESGKLLGRNEDGVYMFKGIPYARQGRWEMPKKIEPWEDLHNAQYSGPACPQTNGTGEYASNPNYFAIDWTEQNINTVNVWTTSMGDAEEPKPVLFWIHGGGYSNGASMELQSYDGKNLAATGEVVVVSVNHRLNYLGFLDLSAYGEEYKDSANIGMADIVTALEWVRDNIAVFGGDPNNVTIFGQSGGSGKVSALMAMPSAKGLFHKAVAMSSGTFAFTRTREKSQAEAAALVEYLGLSDKSNEEIIETLKGLDFFTLAEACSAARVSCSPVMDGEFLMPDITYSTEIPLMRGSVIGEFTNNGFVIGIIRSYSKGVITTEEDFYTNNRSYVSDEEIDARYVERYGDKAEAVKEAFLAAYPGHDLFDGLYANNRDNNLVTKFTEAGGTAYQYVVAYTLPMFGGIVNGHTTGDIALWFKNTVHSWVAGDEEMAEKVSDEMSTALINFAKNGDPSQEGLEWPEFTVENGETMIFDRISEARGYHDQAYMELVTAR